MNTPEPERVHTLMAMYEERYAEFERVMAERKSLPSGAESQRLFDRRSEQIEYLFGCLDGLRNAIHVLDPDKHFHGWRDWGTWEASLRPLGPLVETDEDYEASFAAGGKRFRG